PHLPTIKLISKVCYTVSLVTLLAAFLILASIKRLRCPRNSLHMHLFISFILRALAFLLKDALFIDGVGLSTNVDFNEENVDCKVFTSFWHYVLMANYCWILMEGLYLHSLVFLAFFTDSSGILRYVALGWGLPVLFIISWVVARATLDDTLCWTTNVRQDLFWIIRGPITASIVVNFVLFLNITRVLFAKLFASQTPQARKYRYRKWFKSTLVLVPLFGAHYTFLLGMSLAAAGDRVELIWLYVDQLFSSSQVNFVLFLNITRVLFAKLFASQTPQARKYRYRKWFKSTLVLVPLFGAHYTFLLGMSLAAAGDRVELIWLYVDQLFSSSQVNFVLFLNITRVLFAKLFASQTPQARKYRYRKWFKSTLVLVPLFGAHYTFLLGMSLAAAGDRVELIWLYVDQLFSSSQ
ncbi:parathyroid hormone/parathyroid hormone-related peptide receptor, partial [Ixodes scapularis]